MDRYDRQLRLWGKSGQQQLESAHICIVGKETALLQETLKNLVLAGVSKFTWYCPDEETVKYETDGSSGPKQATSLFYADIVSDLNPLHPTGKVYIEQKGWSDQYPGQFNGTPSLLLSSVDPFCYTQAVYQPEGCHPF